MLPGFRAQGALNKLTIQAVRSTIQSLTTQGARSASQTLASLMRPMNGNGSEKRSKAKASAKPAYGSGQARALLPVRLSTRLAGVSSFTGA
jgi:hypothetical protein